MLLARLHCEEAVVTDAMKSVGQDMDQEARMNSSASSVIAYSERRPWPGNPSLNVTRSPSKATSRLLA